MLCVRCVVFRGFSTSKQFTILRIFIQRSNNLIWLHRCLAITVSHDADHGQQMSLYYNRDMGSLRVSVIIIRTCSWCPYHNRNMRPRIKHLLEFDSISEKYLRYAVAWDVTNTQLHISVIYIYI